MKKIQMLEGKTKFLCSKPATVEEKLGHSEGEELNWIKQGWHGTGKNLYVTQARLSNCHTKSWIFPQGLKTDPPNLV